MPKIWKVKPDQGWGTVPSGYTGRWGAEDHSNPPLPWKYHVRPQPSKKRTPSKNAKQMRTVPKPSPKPGRTTKPNRPKKSKSKRPPKVRVTKSAVIVTREIPSQLPFVEEQPIGKALLDQRKAIGSRAIVPRSTTRRVVHQNQLDAEIKQYAADRSLSSEVAAVLAQSMVPYSAPLVRVKTASTGSNLLATALTRNFITYKYNIKSLIDMVAMADEWLPTIGSPSNPIQQKPLYANLGNYFPVLHYYDPYVVGSVPIPNPLYESTFAYGALTNSNTVYVDDIVPKNIINLDPSGAGFRLPVSASGSQIFMISPANLVPLNGSSAKQPPAQEKQPVIDCEGLRWVWIDSCPVAGHEAIVSISVTMSGQGVPADALAVMLFMLDDTTPNEQEDVLTATFQSSGVGVASVVQLKPLASGFYRIGLRNQTTVLNAAQMTLGVYIYYRTSVVTKFLLNEQLNYSNIETGEAFVGKVQLNGASLLLSNTTQEMGMGGYVYAAQLVDNNTPWAAVSDPDEVIMSNPLVRYQGNWKDGCYGYIKPMKTTELREYTSVLKHTDMELVYERAYAGLLRPDQPDGCLGASAYILNPTLSADQTLYTVTAQLTFCVALEFTSKSQLIQLAHPSIGPEEVERALSALADIDIPFSTNPLHLREMWAKLKAGVANSVKDLGSLAVKAAKAALPSLGPVGSAAGLALDIIS